MGQRCVSSPSSTMETQCSTAPMEMRGERNPEEVLAFADQREDGVQQAERVQGRGHAQPDDAHFSHGCRRLRVVKY